MKKLIVYKPTLKNYYNPMLGIRTFVGLPDFIISVGQATAHWLQRKVRQFLVFVYSQMRIVACGLALQPTPKLPQCIHCGS